MRTYQAMSSHATRQGSLGPGRFSSLSYCGLILAYGVESVCATYSPLTERERERERGGQGQREREREREKQRQREGGERERKRDRERGRGRESAGGE